MGCTGTLILVRSGEALVPSNTPSNRSQAERIGHSLAGDRWRPRRESNLDEAFRGFEERLFVGAYGESALIVWPDIIESIATNPRSIEPWTPLLEIFPSAQVLAFSLLSVVDFAEFLVIEVGRVTRGRAAGPDEGVLFDFGNRLPEEAPLVAEMEAGAGNTPEDMLGEDFVFALTRRWLGTPFDETTLSDYALLEFKRRRWWQILSK